MKKLLDVNNLSISFGGLSAVSNVDLSIGHGELVGLIGPNGAGKTTLFNLLTGVYTPTQGEIIFDGNKITKSKISKINKLGMARTFQNIRLFKEMTVMDNLLVASNNHMTYSPLSGILRLPIYKKEEKKVYDDAIKILDLFSLTEYKDTLAGNLPYGKQRELEIARALATNPSLLLLDEPAAGMNPSETQELMDTISIIRKNYSTSILLIEHDMHLVMGICERLYVLEYGQLIAQGTPEEIKNNQAVITAYLGS